MVGFQAVLFALFTKVFAISERLLPADTRLTRLLERLTLEGGLIGGGLLLLCGLGASGVAFGVWSQQDFGDLIPSQMLRVIIPAATLIMLGAQVIWASFFISILGLKRQ